MKKFSALLLSTIMLCGAVSCGRDVEDKKPDTSDSQPDGNVAKSSKTVINVAEITTDMYIEEKIISFNTKNDLYEVNVTQYRLDDDTYGEEALNSLTREMLAGNIPDIVIGFPQNLDDLQRNGYLTDLYPLMDGFDGMKKDDLLPNVREGLEVDGKLPYIFDNFIYHTYLTQKDYDASESWSLDDAINAYNICSDKQKFLKMYQKQSDLWDFFLGKTAIESIDFENSTCDFGGDFKKALDFLTSAPLPDDIKFDGNEMHYEAGINGVSHEWFFGINDAAAGIFANYSETGYTFAGYPSANGNGTTADVYIMFGITELSPNKEGAWEFLSEFFTLSEQKQRSLGWKGIPVTEYALEALAYDVPAYMGHSIRSEAKVLNSEDNLYTITDNDLEKLLDYTKTADVNIHYNDKLDSIIRMEWLSVYHGEETVDECVDNLNNKIGLYLSERS